jgi:hypothetical protein
MIVGYIDILVSFSTPHDDDDAVPPLPRVME